MEGLIKASFRTILGVIYISVLPVRFYAGVVRRALMVRRSTVVMVVCVGPVSFVDNVLLHRIRMLFGRLHGLIRRMLSVLRRRVPVFKVVGC
jgi:hypothetical protein